MLEYCSNGDLLSYIKEHSEDFKEALSTAKPKKNADDSSLKSQSEMHETIHALSLLIIWSEQVTLLIICTYLNFQNDFTKKILLNLN